MFTLESKTRSRALNFLAVSWKGFHAPHEVSTDSAITRTTVLHLDRTQFRPTYYVYGTIEVLGVLTDGERLLTTATRPRPYSEIYVFPESRLRKLLDIEGNFYLGHLMGYTGVKVHADATKKSFCSASVENAGLGIELTHCCLRKEQWYEQTRTAALQC